MVLDYRVGYWTSAGGDGGRGWPYQGGYMDCWPLQNFEARVLTAGVYTTIYPSLHKGQVIGGIFYDFMFLLQNKAKLRRKFAIVENFASKCFCKRGFNQNFAKLKNNSQNFDRFCLKLFEQTKISFKISRLCKRVHSVRYCLISKMHFRDHPASSVRPIPWNHFQATLWYRHSL